jgi:hypothetical protein
MAQAIPIGLAVAGAAVSAGGTILGANSEKAQLYKEAEQLDIQAGKERASSQRSAMEERRQAATVSSRALALAAASGGGASDPSIVNNIANIEGEGEYRALTSLYNGEETAQGQEAEADNRRTEGRNVKKAALFKAAGTILGAGSTLYDRFGK